MTRMWVGLVTAFVMALSPLTARAQGGDGGRQAPTEAGSYLLNVEDGTVRRLGGPGSAAVLSPDGTMVAVYSTSDDGSSAMHILDLATGAVSDVLVTDQGAIDEPVWSPDGRLLAFQFDRYGRPDPNAIPPSGLFIVSPHTRETVNVLRDALRPWTWAPDGASITGVSIDISSDAILTGIVTIDVISGNVTRTILEPSAAYCVSALAWSPDGGALVFADGVWRQGCGDPELYGLWLWDGAQEQPRRLTSGAAYFFPSWSADGRVLARRIGGVDPAVSLVQLLPDTIVLVAKDGNEQILGTTDGATLFRQPYQETAGTSAAFGVLGCEGAAISSASTTGGASRQISQPGVMLSTASLSPDGARVAWVQFREDAADLVIAMTDGSGLLPILGGAPAMSLGNWSADGRLLTLSVETPFPSCPPY